MAVAYERTKDNPINHDYVNELGEVVENRTFNYAEFFKQLGEQLTKEPTKIAFVRSTPKFLMGALLFSVIVIGYKISSEKKFINGKEYGSSEWGDKKQIKHLFSDTIIKAEIKNIKRSKTKNKSKKIEHVKEKYKSSDIIFTQTEKICMYNKELNNNTIVIGGSGSGKTRGYVLPNILQCTEGAYSPSLVITDPKGEILGKVGKYLKKCGYEIRVLNLKEQNKSFGFNPFDYILEEKFEQEISSLVSCIMNSNNEKEEKGNDPFWPDMAKILLKAIFYAVYEGFPKEERNINTAMEIFRWFEVTDDDDRYTNPTKLDDFFEVFSKNELILKKYGDINVNPALKNWEDFRSKCKGKTAQSVISTALSKIAPFDEKEVRRIFEKDEMELDLVGERKTALFIILPPTNKTYNFIANVLYTQLFDQLEYCATVKHNQELPVPVRFILDEFYNTGKIPNFENILSYARSFGIGISVILQSLDQIKEMYEKSWGTLLDTCSTFLFLGGIRHADTLEYISKLLGKGTFDKKTFSRTKGKQSSTSTSFDKIGRELLDPSEIQRLNKKKCLLFISGYNPYISFKFNYKKHKNYKYTSDYDERNLYSYELDIKGRNICEKVTHGEEEIVIDKKKIKIDYKKTEPIIIDENVEDTVEYLKNNMLNLKIDDNLNYQEDKDIVEKILEEEKNKKIKLKETVKSSFLNLSTDVDEISSITEEFICNKENIDYDDIQINENELNQPNIELDVDLDNVEFSINSLRENMIEDGFIDDLEEIDLDELPSAYNE